jgi:hypothetical protein
VRDVLLSQLDCKRNLITPTGIYRDTAKNRKLRESETERNFLRKLAMGNYKADNVWEGQTREVAISKRGWTYTASVQFSWLRVSQQV